MYSDIGQKSNTMVFSERPGDINALFAQAASVLSASGSKTSQQQSASSSPLNDGNGNVHTTMIDGMSSSRVDPPQIVEKSHSQ